MSGRQFLIEAITEKLEREGHPLNVLPTNPRARQKIIPPSLRDHPDFRHLGPKRLTATPPGE